MYCVYYVITITEIYTIALHVALSFFFFFNDAATTEIYTLSLHDALPICGSDGFLFRS